MKTVINIGAHREYGIYLKDLIEVLTSLKSVHGDDAVVTLDETPVPDHLVLEVESPDMEGPKEE